MRNLHKLNNVGLRATAPRLTVLNIFRTHERRHLTADDVYRWMSDHKSPIGLATVYRVLNQLTEVGILTRTMFDEGAAMYELQDAKPHDHLICSGCGRVEEFSDNVIHERSREIAKSTGYAIARLQLAPMGTVLLALLGSKRTRARKTLVVRST